MSSSKNPELLLADWLTRTPNRITEIGDDPPSNAPVYVMTGPDLIEDVVRAIELNQSVILAGPRGCGKSYCVRAAIKLAAKRGILARALASDSVGDNAVSYTHLTLPTNREV